MALTCQEIVKRAKDMAELSLEIGQVAENPRLSKACRYRAAIIRDHALEVGEALEALLGEIRAGC